MRRFCEFILGIISLAMLLTLAIPANAAEELNFFNPELCGKYSEIAFQVTTVRDLGATKADLIKDTAALDIHADLKSVVNVIIEFVYDSKRAELVPQAMQIAFFVVCRERIGVGFSSSPRRNGNKVIKI